MRRLATALTTRGAVRSGALTGVAQVVLSLTAAGAGALLAQHFGRSAETDGFLAAYAVYSLLVLAAQAFRMVVVPDLTRARSAGQLAPETRAYALSFLLLAIPTCVVVVAFAHPLGDLVTGNLPPVSADVAGRALEILVPAAFVQLLAALAASALAADDSYGTAALGLGVSGIFGLALFAALAGPVGIVGLAWALLANALVAFAVPLVGLVRRGVVRAGRGDLGVLPRLWRLLQGAAVPISLQACYLVGLRLAANLGIGSVTSFTYAYLAASTLVGATGFALSLVTSAPLTRRGVDARAAGAHIEHAAWISLSLVGAATGVFALVGGKIVHLALGEHYGGRVGRDLGLLVVYLAPWMIAWVGFVVTFPLVFVAQRRRLLVPVALLALVVMIPAGLALRSLWGLPGIAIAVGLATTAIALGLMAAIGRQTLVAGAVGLARVGLALGTAALVAFGGLALVLSPLAAAVVGVPLYALILFSMRSLGLGDAWAYVRHLN